MVEDSAMEGREPRKEPFPLEKILTMSASEWCETQERGLQEFDAIGVYFSEHMGDVSGIRFYVPENAVVVTDLQIVYNPGFSVYVTGTALVEK